MTGGCLPLPTATASTGRADVWWADGVPERKHVGGGLLHVCSERTLQGKPLDYPVEEAEV